MSEGKDLAAMNSATLGAEFPEITLPDGSKVQTGTVGALLANIKKYNSIHGSASDGKAAQLSALETSFKASLPLLFKVGFFDLFSPQEWSSTPEGKDNPGRKKVGELALEFQENRSG